MIIESLVGVATGLLGNVLTSFTNFKTQKLKNEFDLAMVAAQTGAMRAEMEMNIRVTETQVQGEIEKIEEDSYRENIKLANVKELDSSTIQKLFDSPWTAWIGVILVALLGFVEFLKGLMRPGLTLYLTIITSWLTYNAYQLILLKQGGLSVEQAYLMYGNVTEIIIYLTVSVITWWFADRRTAKFAMRLNDGNFRK